MVVATKVYSCPMARPEPRTEGGLSRKHIMSAIDASLRRLDMDYVDLYQIHRWDYRTPIEETMEALHDVVRAGKARYIGASSMFAWQFAKAQHTADRNGWTRFVSMQNHYNLVYREEEREMIPQCIDQGVGVSRGARWPAACWPGTGPGTGSSAPPGPGTDPLGDTAIHPGRLRRGRPCAEMAAERGVPSAQVALAWLLHRPGVTAPIVGATQLAPPGGRPRRRAAELSDDEMRAARGAVRPHPVLGHS